MVLVCKQSTSTCNAYDLAILNLAKDVARLAFGALHYWAPSPLAQALQAMLRTGLTCPRHVVACGA